MTTSTSNIVKLPSKPTKATGGVAKVTGGVAKVTSVNKVTNVTKVTGTTKVTSNDGAKKRLVSILLCCNVLMLTVTLQEE